MPAISEDLRDTSSISWEMRSRSSVKCPLVRLRNSSILSDSKNSTSEEAKAKSDSLLLQAEIKRLEAQIDQAVKDGKEHNELVAEMKRVRAELDAKKQVIEDTKGKIDKTKNERSAVKSKISVIVKSIGENAVKTIANELATLAEPEKSERTAEKEKAAAKEAANDPLAAIRDSLDRIERDITETIEENRVETV